jgi:hypothetical protein
MAWSKAFEDFARNRGKKDACIPSCFGQVPKTRKTIYHAELAHFVAVYQGSAALRTSPFEIDFRTALALFLFYLARIAFCAKAEAERVFPIIVFERLAASSAKHMFRPFGGFFLYHRLN